MKYLLFLLLVSCTEAEFRSTQTPERDICKPTLDGRWSILGEGVVYIYTTKEDCEYGPK